MSIAGYLKTLERGHARILDQVDELEKTIHEIGVSPSPLKELKTNRKRFGAFFHFMETVGKTQRRYEDDRLYPVLREQLQRNPRRHAQARLEELMVEHQELEELLEAQRSRFESLVSRHNSAFVDCFALCSDLLHLARRLQRHIWKEKQIIAFLFESSEEESSEFLGAGLSGVK